MIPKINFCFSSRIQVQIIIIFLQLITFSWTALNILLGVFRTDLAPQILFCQPKDCSAYLALAAKYGLPILYVIFIFNVFLWFQINRNKTMLLTIWIWMYYTGALSVLTILLSNYKSFLNTLEMNDLKGFLVGWLLPLMILWLGHKVTSIFETCRKDIKDQNEAFKKNRHSQRTPLVI